MRRWTRGHLQSPGQVVLRNRTVLWVIGIASVLVFASGLWLILNGQRFDGLLFLGVVAVWVVGARLHFVVVK